LSGDGIAVAWLVPLILLAFLVVFPLFWMLVVGLISLLSGWQRLAERYRATVPTVGPTVGETLHMQNGMIGWARYNGVLTLTAGPSGLFMEVFPLFRFAHPRLLIPWQEFRNARVEERFWQKQVRADIGFPTLVTVRLPAALFIDPPGSQVLGKEPSPR
jgi:hypothetical protein